MTDGVVLRATVIRPANRFGQTVLTPYPAIININPYNRAAIDFVDQALHAPPVLGKALHTASASIDATGTALEGLTTLTQTLSGGVFDVFGINRNLVRSGYVQVVVDVRGTGASHGKWQILGPREQQDSVEIIDWVSEQEWCDGTVGLAGWSYSAINSLQAADKRPAQLKAVFAVEGCDDIVRDIYITGGMPSAFIPVWLSAVNVLKWVPNPRQHHSRHHQRPRPEVGHRPGEVARHRDPVVALGGFPHRTRPAHLRRPVLRRTRSGRRPH